MVVSALAARQGGIDAVDALAGHLVANTLLRRSGRNQIEETLVASTLRSGSHSDDVRPPGRPDDGNLVAFHPTGGGAKGLSESHEFSPGAGTGHGGQVGIARGSQVRRLTPVECERLMGWPDNWTAPDGVRAPDSRRYHACGDGVVANVSEWIGRRILAEHSRGGVA